jgi:uncharacterized protein
MKLTVAPIGSQPLLRRYGPNELQVGEQCFGGPLMLGATGLDHSLQAREPICLTEAELRPVFDQTPEVVIIGWIGGQCFLSATQRSWFLARRIGVEVMELGAACRTYNVLVQDGRKVVALLFPNPA